MGACIKKVDKPNKTQIKKQDIPNVTDYKKQNHKEEIFYLKHSEGQDFKKDIQGGRDKIELFFSLKFENTGKNNISQDLQVELQMSQLDNKDNFNSLGETEELEENSLNYHTTFIIDYFFERNQILKFIVKMRKRNQIITTIQTTVGRIMGARFKTVEFPLNNENTGDKSFLIVHAASVIEVVKNTFINFEINMSVKNYGEYYVIISNNINEKSQRVYKSTEYSGKEIRILCKNLNLNDICLGDEMKNITFVMYNVQTAEIVGKINTNLQNINKNEINLTDSSNIEKCEIIYNTEKSTKFIEYLEQGLQISLIVGIDYTASNETPTNPNSLHYIYGKEPNPYETAIRSCGSIVSYYDYDQIFPVFGFGGITPGNNITNHCFPCNLQENPNVKGVEGIISSYKNSLNIVRLDGPTYFHPIIKNVVDFVREESSLNKNVYYILLLITDGQIHDMEMTRSIICEASKFPISIIIIGVGEADFTNMVELDGDRVLLTNKNGDRSDRDIVQFVIFNQFRSNINQLAAEVLYEVPQQVEQFFRKNKFNAI